jgi:AcrR family transcriptional regulator
MPVKAKSTQSGTRRAGTRGVPRAVREEQMLDYAVRAMSERGYAAVAMEEVAAAAGVTKPMVYAYFGSKEGLLAAGAKRAYERSMQVVEQAAADPGTPDERMWRVSLAVFTWAEEYRHLWALIFGSQAVGGEVAAVAAKAQRGMVQAIERVVEESMRDVGAPPAAIAQAEPIAEAIVAVHSAMISRWAEHPEETLELHALRTVSFAWRGLEGLLEGRLWTPPEARP